MRYFVTMPSGREIPVELSTDGAGKHAVQIEGRVLEVDFVDHGQSSSLRVDGRVLHLWLEGQPPEVGVVEKQRRFYARVESEQARALAAVGGKRGGRSGAGHLKSPMPGRVLKVMVSEGDEVAEGTPLLVVEAMKMENELGAPRSGTVSRVHVAAGATVEGGALLIEIG